MQINTIRPKYCTPEKVQIMYSNAPKQFILSRDGLLYLKNGNTIIHRYLDDPIRASMPYSEHPCSAEHASHLLKYGEIYLLWLLPTYFCMGLSLTCTIVFRSVGQVKIPLTCSIIAFFVNVFFNYVFIFGKFGAPRMEIAGAALGTIIARVFELVFICGNFFFKDPIIGYRIKDLLMKCGSLMKEYFRISIPVLISDALLALEIMPLQWLWDVLAQLSLQLTL